jgi:hypothetical protein
MNVIRSLAKEKPGKRNSSKIIPRRYILFIPSPLIYYSLIGR